MPSLHTSPGRETPALGFYAVRDRQADRLQDGMFMVGVLVVISLIIAITAAGISLRSQATVRGVVPAVDIRVGQDLGRGITCRVLNGNVQGRIVLACTQGSKR